MSEKKKKFLEFYNIVYAQGYTAPQILKEINQYCRIPEGTFNDTVNRQKPNLNPVVVLAFCKTYGFDIDDIFREGSPDKQKSPPASIQNDTGAVDTELPNGFQGRFFGYFFNSSPDYTQQGRLDQFILNISSHKITMTLRHFALDNSQRYRPREIMMRGKIIQNEGGKSPSGILAIAFNSEDNTKFCTLAYNKIQLYGQLYFRKGALLTYSRGGDDPMPVMQSFIFTHKKIDLDIDYNRTILQGALALTADKIWLKKNDLDAFRDSETIRKYFKARNYENDVQEYAELDETTLLSLNVDDRDKLYEILLQMKARAINPRLFRFPNSSIDRSWRYVAALGQEPSQEQEGERQVFCEESPDIGISGKISTENLTSPREAEFSQ